MALYFHSSTKETPCSDGLFHKFSNETKYVDVVDKQMISDINLSKMGMYIQFMTEIRPLVDKKHQKQEGSEGH
jgi:hypothetical protein